MKKKQNLLVRIIKWFTPWLRAVRLFNTLGKLMVFGFALGIILLALGLYWGLWIAPADYQQLDAFRIIYVHVPAAFLSMFVYVNVVVFAAVGLIWRIKYAHWAAYSAAGIGAWFTFLALFTGAVWGKPMWGTWWEWDARLTSELILLFLYLGYLLLYNAFDNKIIGQKASAVLAIAGLVNIPIIHFSVYWWNTLHQGATLSRFAKPAMDTSMLIPLLILITAYFCYYMALLALRLRREIISEQISSKWLHDWALK